MENQEAVEQIAINCGVSMEDAAASIQRFSEAFGAIRDVVESLYEAVKARNSRAARYQEDHYPPRFYLSNERSLSESYR